MDYFKDRVAYYIGIDISATAIKVAKEKFKDYQNVFFFVEDFESSNSWTEYAGDVNFVIANESLYYCDVPKAVIAKLDKYMVPSSYLLIADSIVRYTTRESPHRDFNFELIKKVTHNLFFIDEGRWSLKAFLTKKLKNKED